MKIKSAHLVPFGLCGGIFALLGGLALLTRLAPQFDLCQRLEWMTYDWRVRQAATRPTPASPQLGFVFISDDTITALLDGSLDYRAGLYWPRHVYGHLVHELAAQGATAVGFDIFFAERRPDHPPVPLPDGSTVDSDVFFARELAAAGNVVLAANKGLLPAPLFRTNAWSLGAISARPESDGILRRTRAFEDCYSWHPLIGQLARLKGLDLRLAVFHPDRLVLPAPSGEPFELALFDGRFNQVALYESLTGTKPPGRVQPMQEPASRIRVWDMGIVLAARQLHLDLTQARVELEHGRILLPGPNGQQRVIPIDSEGRFYIDWTIRPSDPSLTKQSMESLLFQDRDRRLGQPLESTNRWTGKLAVVGSIASGNDLTDVGATPLEKETYLTSRFWNVAQSILTDRFIRPPSLALELLLILLLGGLALLATWKLRSFSAVGVVLFLAAAYLLLARHLYLRDRVWLPLFLPMSGLVLTHFSFIAYRAFFEQSERRRIRAIFSKIVSPNVVAELLGVENLSLGGARRHLSVFFADVRGFTELTDDNHAAAEDYVRRHNLTPEQTTEYFNAQSAFILDTVNQYLGLIADIIKKHEGTLDKYIGDCVMAFWGAPTPNPSHAVSAVTAAIEAQRALHALNMERAAENQRREAENQLRAQNGLDPLPPLKLLALGIGVNTGTVITGLMGSRSHILNYTVFGRDVNLASRLESLSGRSRIMIGESTYNELLRHAPALTQSCTELAPTLVKGFRSAVKVYEVRWKQDATPVSAPAPGPAVAAAPASPPPPNPPPSAS